jgi:primase-polymerase (primpol)-like protein
MIDQKKSHVPENLVNNVVDISTTVSSGVKKPKSYFNPNPEDYSSEMKEYDQWVLSRLKKKPDGKYTKIPCDKNGRYTDGTDKNSCHSFTEAFEICKVNPYKFSGIGFSVFPSCPIKAIDFDHIYDLETGKWNQQAWEELKIINSRIEWGPSFLRSLF